MDANAVRKVEELTHAVTELREMVTEALEAINEDAGGLDFPPLERGCGILQNALKEK